MNGKYDVIVWFRTSAAARTVAQFDDLDAAMRESRRYLSDSRSVVVQSPRGDAIVVKSLAGMFF